MHTDFVKTGEGASGHAIIQVDENGQNCIITYGGTNRQFTEAWIDEVLTHFEAGDIAVLQNEINLIPYIMARCASGRSFVPVISRPPRSITRIHSVSLNASTE